MLRRIFYHPVFTTRRKNLGGTENPVDRIEKMFTASNHSGAYAQVKEVLGEFWEDFEIDEIVSRAFKFDGEKYTCVVDEAGFWDIAASADKCLADGIRDRYDYRAVIRGDIREAVAERDLSEFDSRDEAEESLSEALWIDDAVTGNASGSYTFNSWRAENYLAHNWDLLAEALDEFEWFDVNVLEKGAEWCDVTIRCYLLSECLGVVLDELERVGVAKWNR